MTAAPLQWGAVARRIRVPMGFLFAAVFLWHLYYVSPTYRSLALSLLLVLPGALLRAYASGYVKKNAELATRGPYAYTRNPLYLGSMLMAFGFAAASRSWFIFGLLLVLFALIYLPTIFFEEAFLRRTFPDFDAYTREVPRLFPRFNSAAYDPSVSAGGFSFELYRRHREYNAALGAIAIYAVLLGRIVLGHGHF